MNFADQRVGVVGYERPEAGHGGGAAMPGRTGSAYVVKPVDFHEFVNAIKELGVFWAIINEPPPGSVAKGR